MELDISVVESEEEKEEIFRQRYEVYTKEMNLYHDVADHENQILSDEDDNTARHLCGKDDGVIVTSLRMHFGCDSPFPPEYEEFYELKKFIDHVSFDKMCIASRFTLDAGYRKGTVSFQMIEAVYKHCSRADAELVFLDCVPHLVNLYASLGWRRYGRNVKDPDVGILVPMCLVLKDQAHLKQIQSLFLKFSREYFGTIQPPEWVPEYFAEPATQEEIDRKRQENWSKIFGLLNDPAFSNRSVFDGIPMDTLKNLMNKSNILECDNGDVIIKKGTMYHSVFIILSGKVEVRQGERVIAVLTKGDIIGELAFLLGIHRSADIYADSDDVQILHLSESKMREIIKDDSKTGSHFYHNLSRILGMRLISTNQILGEMGS